MTSIKDKPLKKITGDTRVKIDSLHNDKLKELRSQRNEITETVTSYLEENSLENAKIELDFFHF